MTNLLTIRQACEALQVCRNTLQKMIADGAVTAINLRRPGMQRNIWRIDISTAGQELSVQERLKLKKIERRLSLV